MAKLTMLEMAKRYDFPSDFSMMEYFVESHTNGNFGQCRKMFYELNKQAQKELLSYLVEWQMPKIYAFYFNALL